jgi:hypothetical protein
VVSIDRPLEELFSRSKTDLLFKGLGSLKYFFVIVGNVEHLKACRLILFTPPPLWYESIIVLARFSKSMKLQLEPINRTIL